MEMKTKLLDKKHIFIIIIAILSIIISYFNVTYAYFEDSKNQPISIKSEASFGESTVYEPKVYIEGSLSSTTKIKNTETLSFKKDNVETYDYLLTVATQVDPRNTEYKDNEYTSISYEIYHKTQEDLDTSSFTCTEGKYNNGTSEDTCSTGTFIENSLNGLPFELIKDYKITDTNTHYFDVYIYLNDETASSKNIKTRIFYLDKETEKEVTGKTLEEVRTFISNNEPDLNTGLIPVVYDDKNGSDTHWFVADTTKAWYDYESQWWANAVSVDSSTTEKREKYVNTDGTYKTGTEIATADMLAMFVWIPRYSYTIGCTDESTCLGYKIDGASDLAEETPGAIDIKFVAKDVKEDKLTEESIYPIYNYNIDENGMPSSDRNPENWYTHPAFDFGNDKLSGIWVGKFETTGNFTTPTVLPNVSSLRNQSVSEQFLTAQIFTTSSNIYGLIGDTHMMKNSEWGAVSYLSQSIYGKYGNSNYTEKNKEIYLNNYNDYNTGVSAGSFDADETNSIICRYNEKGNMAEGTGECGPGASTTGNIYGIYDMSGGAYEYVMGYYTEASTTWGSTSSSDFAEFTIKPDDKYFDGYKGTIDGETKTINILKKSTEVIGHATYETKTWYSDTLYNLNSSDPWVARGGYCQDSTDAGVFYLDHYDGGAWGHHSFRSVLVSNES